MKPTLRSDPYPEPLPLVPRWAARIWVDSDEVHLELCSPKPGARGHRVSVPNNPSGWRRVQLLVSCRDRESVLNTKGAPTQLDLNEPKHELPEGLAKSTRDILKKMGLI